MTEGARYERLQSYKATVTVDLHSQPERLEHRPAQFGIGFGQRLCEVGQRVEDCGGLLNVEPAAVALRLVELGDRRLDLLALGFQGADSFADDGRIDPGLDRGELALDPLIYLAELAAGALSHHLLYYSEQICSMNESRNPFRYSEPVPPEELLNRDDEARALLEAAVSGNNSRLVAPRRYGKTSLLARVAREAREQKGWAAVYVDFFGALTLDDIAQRIERAYAAELQGRLATWFAGVRRLLRPTLQVGGGSLPAGVEVTIDPQAEPPLVERLALPTRLYEKHGTRTLVIFDEFQDILSVKERADAVIRSEIQHHGDAASYVFAGSHVGMMRELFTDRRRAFYGQAGAVDLPPLRADDVAGYLSERFEATGRRIGTALGPLLDTAVGHPQRTMLLAYVLWELTAEDETASEETWLATYDRVMRDVRDELRAVWSALNPSQRRVLAAVAEGREGIYAAGRRHGGSRGGAAVNATEALVDRGEITEDPSTASGMRVIDPLLAAWVNEGRHGV